MAAELVADTAAWDEVRFGVTRLDVERKPITGKINAADRILQFTAVPLPDGNTLLTFADISDSARMERALRDRADALEAADRLKNMFLSNVSYEIRTPLTSILGFAEGLQMGLAGPLTPKQQEYVRDIRKSSADLKTIIDAIIDLTAIDAGAMELKLEQVDVTALLEAVAEKLAPADRHARPDAQHRGRRRCRELRRRSEARGADPLQPALQCHRLLGAGRHHPHGGQAHGGNMLSSGCRIRAAASSRNSRSRPSSASSRAPFPAAIAARALALPSSRASSNCMRGRSRCSPRSTRAPRFSAPSRSMGPAAAQRSWPATARRGRRPDAMQMTTPLRLRPQLEGFAAELSLFARPGMVLLLKGDLGAASPPSPAPSSAHWREARISTCRAPPSPWSRPMTRRACRWPMPISTASAPRRNLTSWASTICSSTHVLPSNGRRRCWTGRWPTGC